MPKILSLEEINTKLEPYNLVCTKHQTKKSNFTCGVCNKDFEARYQDVLRKKVKNCACGRNKKFYKMEELLKTKTKLGMLTPVKYLGKVGPRR